MSGGGGGREGGRERERERERQNPKQAPGSRAVSTESDAGLELGNSKIMTWAGRTLN